MSRRISLGTSLGAVDIHFHGAFGIDLMTASRRELDRLSRELWKNGVAAICPTTLSDNPERLLQAVRRLGSWIRDASSNPDSGALPLGIHLEGPFINSAACGAHPDRLIRPWTLCEAEALWEASQGTLLLMTIAPEIHSASDLRKLIQWSRKRKIRLSIGHSLADEATATRALALGFSGVTHAWNASGFHHRAPGVLGAAIGRPGVHLELIVDQVHVARTVLDWSCRLHSPFPVCFVSDCVPAARARPAGSWCDFGPLRIREIDGACRLKNGSLAGGGKLLPQAFCDWAKGRTVPEIRAALPHLNRHPLQAVGVDPARLRKWRLRWDLEAGHLSFTHS